MSQYGTRIEVILFNPERRAAIEKEVNQVWKWGSWHLYQSRDPDVPTTLVATGQSNLEDNIKKFAKRIMQAVWRANQSFCEVFVEITFLERHPTKSFLGSRKEYKEAKAAGLLKGD